MAQCGTRELAKMIVETNREYSTNWEPQENWAARIYSWPTSLPTEFVEDF